MHSFDRVEIEFNGHNETSSIAWNLHLFMPEFHAVSALFELFQ